MTHCKVLPKIFGDLKGQLKKQQIHHLLTLMLLQTCMTFSLNSIEINAIIYSKFTQNSNTHTHTHTHTNKQTNNN